MEKKKKRPTTWIGRNWKAILTITAIGLSPVVCFAAFLFWGFGIEPLISEIQAFAKINKMEYWELPPDSEFISFESWAGGGGTMTWVSGEMIIASYLSQEQIRDFYWTHYPAFGSIEGRIAVSVIGQERDGRTLYRIWAAQPTINPF